MSNWRERNRTKVPVGELILGPYHRRGRELAHKVVQIETSILKGTIIVFGEVQFMGNLRISDHVFTARVVSKLRLKNIQCRAKDDGVHAREMYYIKVIL